MIRPPNYIILDSKGNSQCQTMALGRPTVEWPLTLMLMARNSN